MIVTLVGIDGCADHMNKKPNLTIENTILLHHSQYLTREFR